MADELVDMSTVCPLHEKALIVCDCDCTCSHPGGEHESNCRWAQGVLVDKTAMRRRHS